MAAVGVTYDGMRSIIQNCDLIKLERLVHDGLDLAEWKGRHGYNIYHLCATVSDIIRCACPVPVAKAVARLCPSHRDLLRREGADGCTPPLLCCRRRNPYTFRLAMLEYFFCVDSTLLASVYDRCLQETTDNIRTRAYLQWRKYHSKGLPSEMAQQNNEVIMQYIDAVEKMDDRTAIRYMSSVQGGVEKSRHIRIILLGPQGAGKTTLMFRLRGQNVPAIYSTNQLNVFHNILIGDMDTNTCWTLFGEIEQDAIRKRLQDLIAASMSSSQNADNPGDIITGSTCGAGDAPSSGTPDLTFGICDDAAMATMPSGNLQTGSTYEIPPQDKKEYPVELQSEAAIILAGCNHDPYAPLDPNYSITSKAYISIFDFGGEILFSNFQHIFLNTNEVILLCFGLHSILEGDKSALDIVYFWLKFLSTFSVDDIRFRPPVILVGTHLDLVETSQRAAVKDTVISRLCQDPDVKNAYHRHVLGFEVVDNTLEFKDVKNPYNRYRWCSYPQNQEIWNLVFAAAKYQSQWEQLLPTGWILLERDLMVLKGQRVRVITLNEVKCRAKRLSVPLGDDDVVAMLRYLHGLRLLLCFQLDNPDANIILDIEWLIEAFRLIVTTLKFHLINQSDPNMAAKYENPKLTMHRIRQVWSSNETFDEFTDILLFYLERVELIVKPLPGKGETHVDYYIVPCLLADPDPRRIRRLLDIPATITSSTLCFDFMGRYIPQAIFNKILAACIHRFTVFMSRDQEHNVYLQQGLACFELCPRWNMVLHCKDSRLKITLFSSKVSSIQQGDGFLVRSIMEAIIEATLDRNQQTHLKYQILVSPDFEVVKDESMEPLVIPTESTAAVGVKRTVWFPQEVVRKAQEMESGIRHTHPTPREMIRIAKHIGNTYSLFFVRIGLWTNLVERMRSEHEQKRDLLSIWTTLLFTWRDRLGQDANLGLIQDAMEFCGFDYYSLQKDIKKLRAGAELHPLQDIGLPVPVQMSRPQEHELEQISILILKGYFVVFIELGVQKSTIEMVEMEERKPMDMITKLLRHWIQTQTKVSVLQLYLCLAECELNTCCDFIDLMNRRPIARTDEDNISQGETTAITAPCGTKRRRIN